MKLIYHPKGITNQVSPFDEALLRVSENANPLCLASPYIGLELLNRILINTKSWKLLSDIEAWLSLGNRKTRAKCWQFILENIDNIRHVPDLHAKVAIGNNLLFLGSANFTNKGILGRDELSVLIDNQAMVTESAGWFNDLWNDASTPVIQEGDELVKALNEAQWTAPKSRIRLTTQSTRVKAVLSSSTRPNGLDVALAFAKSGISESDKLLPIEEAYHEVSDILFNSDAIFTFKDLLDEVSKLNTNTQSRDLWPLIIHETVNHWLGGFFDDGFDRYVYDGDVFQKWDFSHLDKVKNNDNLLSFLIGKINLSPEISYLPFPEDLSEFSISVNQFILLVDQFIDVGFLIEHDNPGELPTYSIDRSFEWPKRWQKFTSAHKLFDGLSVNLRSEVTDEFDDEFDGSFQEYSDFTDTLNAKREAYKALKNTSKATSKTQKKVKENAKKIDKLDGAEYKAADQALIYIFQHLDSKRGRLHNADIKYFLKEFLKEGSPKHIRIQLSNLDDGMFIINHPNDILPISLNPNWDGSHYLKPYPNALSKWKALISDLHAIK